MFLERECRYTNNWIDFQEFTMFGAEQFFNVKYKLKHPMGVE